MKKSLLMTGLIALLSTFSFHSAMSQGGAIKVFESGDIVIGGLSIGGFGLNMNPYGHMYLNTQIYTPWSWVNVVNANHDQQACNMVTKDGICNSWDLGDGTRWARKTFYSGSDKRLKTNIEDLTNSLNIVLNLRGVSYNFINDLKPFVADTIVIIDKNGNRQTVITNEDDLWNDTTHYSRYILDQLRREISWRHFGVIAQEVQQVLPEAVRTMPDGMFAVEYNSLIPYLIEAIKALNSKIEYANSSLKNEVILKESENNLPIKGNAKLYQNKPNPFSKETVIKYELNSNIKDAEILIFNMQGTLLKSITLTASGEIVINKFEFKPGMYLYSLIQDGVEIDTKKFILTDDN